MTPWELYERGAATLVASWAEYARGANAAEVRLVPGAAVAVFAAEPERLVYNNALLDRGLDADARVVTLDAVEAAYADAGVDRFAAWVHETDAPLRTDLEGRGYVVSESTRAMGLSLDELDVPRPDLDLVPAGWHDYVAMIGLGADFLQHADPAAYVVRIARLDGRARRGGDGLRPRRRLRDLQRQHARARPSPRSRQGAHRADAARGARPRLLDRQLQSTPMAERVYASVGFRDLGRYLEHSPAAG